LGTAITRLEEAVEATPQGDPGRAVILNNIGNYLGNPYRRTKDLLDVEAAIAKFEEAVLATPRDNPFRAGMLSNLGHSLST